MLKTKSYLFEDIKRDKNLLFDIKHDNIFRNVFLNKCSFNYVCKLFSYILGYDYDDLKNNLRIVNNEYASNSAYNSINRSDIIYDYKGTYIILEMNLCGKRYHINKNYYYLFKQHSSRLNNKNNYEKKTILINIDNYNVSDKDDLIYEAKIQISKYNQNIYNYINILHINLDALHKKVYNKEELNWIEKFFLIFVEQDKRKLMENKVEKEVKSIMDYISKLDFKEGEPVTYNYIEAEKVRKKMIDEDEERVKEQLKFANEQIKNANEQMKNANEQIKNANEQTKKADEYTKQQVMKLDKDKRELDKDKKELEQEKISFAKALKAEGYSIQKILKMTKLPENKIRML